MKKEICKMSEREQMYQLLDTIPDNKIAYIIGYIQGLTTTERDIPNAETLAAFAEVDEMKKTGSAQSFNNLDDLWASLEE